MNDVSLKFQVGYSNASEPEEIKLKQILAMVAFAAAVIALVEPTIAGQSEKLIGLSEEQLISCVGIPAGQMVAGNSTFFQYGEFNARGAFIPLGNMLLLTTRQRGCQAVVTLQNGVVTKVTLKTKGLISGPLACQRIFSGC